MKSISLGAHALSGAVGIVLLASCGGRGASTSAIPSADLPQAATHSRTFNYTGAKQSFVVPAGVTRITVVARGAGGVSCPRTGRGARVYAVIPVTPRERLTIYVGGGGAGLGGTGGFNGGGASYSGYGGGGGASDVRVRPGGLRDRILVAAGGGSSGLTYFGCAYRVLYGTGGGGGGLTGENGQPGEGTFGVGGGGSGGTQTHGGAGGEGGSGNASFCPYGPGKRGADGALGVGGAGAKTARYHRNYGAGGGGGGGGYFGGGGGGGSCLSRNDNGGGGGGGGSSYAEPRATNVHYWPNWKNASGDGLVVFSW